MPWTAEEARAWASAGGKARAEQRKREGNKSPEERAVARFAREADSLSEELIKAAKGEDGWEELKATDRLGALLRVLEYGIGKPTANPKDEKKPTGDTPEPDGLVME